jgi:hypothetical protein
MALNERDTRDPRLERIYRDAAREAPPAQLDAAILAAARREVGARPRGLSAALRRWHVPVSIAAVVVVSVSLVILMREEGGGRLEKLSIPPLTAPIDKSSTPPMRAPPAADLKAAARPPVESPAPVTLGKLEGSSAAISGIGAAPSEPAAEPSARPFVASPPSPAPGVGKTTPAPADTAAPGRLETTPSASGERRSAAAEADVAQPRPMARAIVAKPAVADRLPVWQGLEKEPPEKWLARMDELTREGRTAEAEEMRAEFKRRFPDHPLGQASK